MAKGGQRHGARAIVAYTKASRPATQGGSLANMGDNMPSNGLNAPRGYYSDSQANRGMLATGSTPLSRTGSYNANSSTQRTSNKSKTALPTTTPRRSAGKSAGKVSANSKRSVLVTRFD